MAQPSYDESLGRGRRPRVIPDEYKHRGHGMLEPVRRHDFKPHLRQYLANQIKPAYDANKLGKYGSERFMLARSLGIALEDGQRTLMDALRHHMEKDGLELVKAIGSLTPALPALKEDSVDNLFRWVAERVKNGE